MHIYSHRVFNDVVRSYHHVSIIMVRLLRIDLAVKNFLKSSKPTVHEYVYHALPSLEYSKRPEYVRHTI